MSAPPLNKAVPISDGASFYNPVEAISQVVETTPETGEGVSPPQNSTQSMRGLCLQVADSKSLLIYHPRARHKLHILVKMTDLLYFVLLQREVELLKDAKRKLELENEDLKRDIREVERLYADIKAQKDSLKAELEPGATLDSGIEGLSRKRRRLE
ncbi:hypothetical protein BJ878DRAFT_483070 [Calycina marina]|uniref:Uncharacterized protein n=1 Tax=Calycina marina TaxID=1763456 RepID=A0A9P8CC72_9HELO|nr:hypothetical protein BJ878DRAFT_483070 [Calycina marina]